MNLNKFSFGASHRCSTVRGNRKSFYMLRTARVLGLHETAETNERRGYGHGASCMGTAVLSRHLHGIVSVTHLLPTLLDYELIACTSA
jgi:hypothetical protein